MIMAHNEEHNKILLNNLLESVANLAKAQELVKYDKISNPNDVLDLGEVQRASPRIAEINKNLIEQAPEFKEPLQKEVDKIRKFLADNPSATHKIDEKIGIKFTRDALEAYANATQAGILSANIPAPTVPRIKGNSNVQL